MLNNRLDFAYSLTMPLNACCSFVKDIRHKTEIINNAHFTELRETLNTVVPAGSSEGNCPESPSLAKYVVPTLAEFTVRTLAAVPESVEGVEASASDVPSNVSTGSATTGTVGACHPERRIYPCSMSLSKGSKGDF